MVLRSVVLAISIALCGVEIGQCQSSGRDWSRQGVYEPERRDHDQQPPPNYNDQSNYRFNQPGYGKPGFGMPYGPQNRPPVGEYDQTYEFNNRRYGQGQFGTGFIYDDHGNPILPTDDRYRFQQPKLNQPGILSGWRPDLQGKLRDNSKLYDRDRDIFVRTNLGQVQGFKVYLYDDPNPKSGYRPETRAVEYIRGNVSVFLGIPYAQPPVKEGRFKPPRVHRGWQLLQAVDYGPACPQPVKYTGATKGVRDVHEDCLYLNVFSPTTAAGLARKFPTMVYIHGGEFSHGSSNMFPAHILAGFYDVVVVTINYRLGALGFLSTGDLESPGNYGMLDQAMALRWVHDNIEFFNGDPNSVTLFGPDAGAASAGLLMVWPRTRHLVHRVIAQSGSAIADWALTVDRFRAVNTSRVFGMRLGCSIESSWKLVTCLKNGRSSHELGNAEFSPQIGSFPWAPVLDHNITLPDDTIYPGWVRSDWEFLKETPAELIAREEYNTGLQYMGGVTTQEAAHFIYNNESLAPYYEINEKFFSQKIREFVLRYNYTLNPHGVYEAIKYMYTFWPDPTNVTMIRERYIEMLSDFLYRAPADAMAKLLVNNKVDVYLYVLNTTIEALRLPRWRSVSHDTEHLLLAGAPFMDVEFFPKKLHLERTMWTDNDRNMSHFFMKAYSNFARYGNPSYENILGLHFDLARVGYLKYLNINTTFNSSILYNYRQTELAFWSHYMPTVVGMLVATYRPTTEYWFEAKEPLQIAFWSVSGTCLLLVVVIVMVCLLWLKARRQSDPYFNGDILMLGANETNNHASTAGVDNHSAYEYRDDVKLHRGPTPPATKRTPGSTTSSLRGSNSSLGGREIISSSPRPRSRTSKVADREPLAISRRPSAKTLTGEDGVPQTQV